MPRINTAIDPPHTQAWIAPIGKFVLNFAAVELETYLWLSHLLQDDKAISSMIGARFKARVDMLLREIDSAVSDTDLKLRCVTAWNEALGVAVHRNVLVHNPIVYGWSTTDQSGPPDLIGIPDLNHLGEKVVTTNPTMTLKGLHDLVNRTSALAQRLFSLRQELGA